MNIVNLVRIQDSFDKSEIVPFSDIEVGKWYYLNRQGSFRFGPDKKVKMHNKD